MIIRRFGRDEPSSRKESSRGDGPGSSRRPRSNRCTRKDSIRRSIRRNRTQSQIVQTHVREILHREILLRETRHQRSLHESHHRGSRLRQNRLHDHHHHRRRRERTPQSAESGRLPQVRSKYEQGAKRFPHHASSIGTISFPRIRHFLQRDYSAIEGRSRSTGCEPRLSIIIRTANEVAVCGHLMQNANHTFLDAVRKSERGLAPNSVGREAKQRLQRHLASSNQIEPVTGPIQSIGRLQKRKPAPSGQISQARRLLISSTHLFSALNLA